MQNYRHTKVPYYDASRYVVEQSIKSNQNETKENNPTGELMTYYDLTLVINWSTKYKII